MLSLSNPKGYDDRSLVSASVSRLARWRPLYAEGTLDSLCELPVSIWKVNDPNPEDAVDICEPVERPSVRRSGGAGRRSSSCVVDE